MNDKVPVDDQGINALAEYLSDAVMKEFTAIMVADSAGLAVRDILRDALRNHTRDAGGYCHPRDDSSRRWMLVFDDADLGHSVFYDEAEAYAAYHLANVQWNCHLFVSARTDRTETLVLSESFANKLLMWATSEGFHIITRDTSTEEGGRDFEYIVTNDDGLKVFGRGDTVLDALQSAYRKHIEDVSPNIELTIPTEAWVEAIEKQPQVAQQIKQRFGSNNEE